MQTFEELEVWKTARDLRKDISQFTKSLPAEEKYSLCSQLKRASRSVTANIAEGFGRFHYQENIQFCRQSRGSLMEVLDHLICARDENYMDETMLSSFKTKILLCNKILNGYISYLKKAKQNEKKPALTD
ncbi:MAG: four helix bundle protein [Bacteroidetes bacterium]|nr:four helix bundle protein [Bacteroidota bacterium]